MRSELLERSISAQERADRALWLRRYKWIACIGKGAAAAAVFEGSVFLFWQISSAWRALVTLVVVTLGMGLGYLAEELLLRLFRKNVNSPLEFTYENKIRRPHGITLLSTMLVGALLCFMIWIFFSYLEYRTALEEGWPVMAELDGFFDYFALQRSGRAPVNFQVSQLAISIGALYLVYLGAYLRPLHFHQVLGLRSLIESLGLLTFIFAIESYFPPDRTASLFFFVASLVAVACLSLIMNQGRIIEPSYTSPTCRVTTQMRLAGMGEIARQGKVALGIFFMMCGGVSAIVFLISIPFWAMAPEMAFFFPVKNAPVLNAVIVLLGLLSWFVLLVILCARVRWPHIMQMFRLLQDASGRVFSFLRRFFRFRLWWGRVPRKKVPPSEQPRRTMIYEDTVIRHVRRDHRAVIMSPAAFSRNLAALPDRKEKYRYAYRTLTDCLIRKHIGIDIHSTPVQIAEIVQQRTNIQNIREITQLFEAAAYAGEMPEPDERELEMLCSIVRTELEREHRTR